MKHYLLLLIIIFSSTLLAYSQFTHYYNYASVEVAYCVRETSDSCYIVAIGGGTSPDIGVILKIDFSGNILWDYIDQSSVATGNYVYENANSDFTFLEEQSIVQSPNIVLKRFTKTGALIWSKDTLVPWLSEGACLIEETDSNLIIAGTVEHPGQYQKVLLIKCNQFGDTLFTKEYGNPPLCIQGLTIINAIDSGYILACNKYSPSNSKIKSTVIIKTDFSGNELWRKEFAQSHFFGGYGDCIKIIDSLHYAFCISSFDSLSNKYTPELCKINLTADTIFTQFYPSSSSCLVSSFLYEASSGYEIIAYQIPVKGFQILYTDTNGIFVCSQLVKDSIYGLQPYSMVKNHEGKFVISGMTWDTAQVTYDSFVMVIDSACDNFSFINSQPSRLLNIEMYPNPTNSSISIHLNNLYGKEV